MEYDNRGKVSLWKNDREGDRQPVVTGNLVAHRDIKEGETIRIALWKSDDVSGRRPVMTGKISDTDPTARTGDDDGIPF